MQRRLFAHKTNAPAAHKSLARLQARLPARAGLLESRSRRSGMGGLQAWLANGWIQAKLEVSQPGDRSEIEADRVADQVMTAPEREDDETKSPPPQISRMADEEQDDIARKCAECESEERELSGKDTVAELNRLRASGGESLGKREQAFFGGRFGRDISGVRIHQGPAADRLARALNAKAFTLGQDIVFREGEYSPGTHAGKKLLAHEITHTVQQSGGETHRVFRQCTNGTSEDIFIKPGGGPTANQALRVRPGETSRDILNPPNRFGEPNNEDGVTMPAARRNEVFQVPDGVNSTARPGGNIDLFLQPNLAPHEALMAEAARRFGSGWRDIAWLLGRWQAGDRSWDALFASSGVDVAAERRRAGLPP